jgi:hypothetical protein
LLATSVLKATEPTESASTVDKAPVPPVAFVKPPHGMPYALELGCVLKRGGTQQQQRKLLIPCVDEQLSLKGFRVTAVMDLIENPQCVAGIVQLKPFAFVTALRDTFGSTSGAFLVGLTQSHLDPNLGGSV